MNDKLSHSFLFKGFRKTLSRQLGEAKAARVWQDANARLRVFECQTSGLDRDSKMMIPPAAAFYEALHKHAPEQALPLLVEYGTHTGKKIARIVHSITSIPGVPKLLWKNMPALMRKMSGPEKGYTRRIVSETDALVGVDILSCPLHDAAVKLGVPEAALVVCAMDKACMTGFKHILYTRTTSVAAGEDCCDYRLRYDETKP